MECIETERLILRRFVSQDWPEVLELAIDWKSAPGPEFDKLPTKEDECKQFTNYLTNNSKYFAMCLRNENKVVGLLALNGFDENKQFDLGHIIHSKYQDNDHDREAIAAIIDFIFKNNEVLTIITHNADHYKQLAPLKSLGFKNGNVEKGELIIKKAEWEKLSGKARK